MTAKKPRKNKDNVQPMTIAWRFNLVIGGIALVFFGLILRAAYIQVIEPDMLKAQGDLRSLRTATKDTHRGSIVDRNGEELAVSVPVQTVYADPKYVIEKDGLSKTRRLQALADVLGMDITTLRKRIGTNPKKRFVYLARQINPAIAQYVKELKIPGIHLRKESKRFYPAGEITAHLIGFTDVDDNGIEGLERVYNDVLTGESGKKQYRKDAKGNLIEVLDEQEAQQPQDIVLSIDQRIQALAYRELIAGIKSFKADSGSAVVVDVHTGEILALVNGPSFNPNNRKGVATHRFRNRAITDVVEPGSTMKALTVLSALEFGSADTETVIKTGQSMRIGGRVVTDVRGHGEQTLADILKNSSNVGSARLALDMPKDYFIGKFYEMGFSEDTGTGLIGETSGMISDSNRWSKHEIASLSYGYNLAISPLQLARFYAALGNGGIKKPLSVLKDPKFNEGERVASEENVKILVDMLELAVKDGGGWRAKVEGYRVGGKTGTAKKSIAGGYGNDYRGLFAGIAPLSDPKVVVVVVIDDPAGDLYHGGEIAAPVFSKIMAGTLRYLNLAPDDIPQLSTQATSTQLSSTGVSNG